jgi:hypothetical protein
LIKPAERKLPQRWKKATKAPIYLKTNEMPEFGRIKYNNYQLLFE